MKNANGWKRKWSFLLLATAMVFFTACEENGFSKAEKLSGGVSILINHLGYDAEAPKKAVIEADKSLLLFRALVIDLDSGKTVLEGSLDFVGAVPSWKNWNFLVFDFSGLRDEGNYAIRVFSDNQYRQSEAFAVKKNLLLGETFSDVIYHIKSQRCSGEYDRRDRALPFYGGRPGTVDAHGGWYDASGDTSKYLSHLSYANFMNPQQTPLVVWGLLDSFANLSGSSTMVGDMSRRVSDEALHGADFLVRMQDAAGYFYQTVFDQWSKDLEKRMICSYSTQEGIRSEKYQAGYRQGGGLAIAALARASTLGRDGEFSSRHYLEAAEKGFLHLEKHNSEYLADGRENIIDDYCALLAATELFAATGKSQYREAAQKRAAALLARLTESGWWRADDAGEIPFFHAVEAGLPVIALLRYREKAADQEMAGRIEKAVLQAMEYELQITAEEVNPFGYARQLVKPLDEGMKKSFFIPHKNPSGYWWQGENARLASLAAAAFRVARLPGVDTQLAGRLHEYAFDQLNWILGLNPFDICMLNGHGRNNVDYEPGYHNGPGGIINGITAGFENEDDIDFLPASVAGKGDHRWRWSEQWLPHAAWYLIAISSK